MGNTWKKLTKWIDRKPSKVDLSKRIMAYIVDWIIGGILAGFPGVFMYALLTDSSEMFTDLYSFPALGFPNYYAYLIGIVCVLLALVYYVYVPYKIYPGQTLAKKWFGIKIVKVDGKDIDLKTLLIRNVLGLMLIESSALVVNGYIRQMLTLLTGLYVDYVFVMVGGFITMISAMFFYLTASNRCLHDYLANTRVALETEKYVPSKKEKKQLRANKK